MKLNELLKLVNENQDIAIFDKNGQPIAVKGHEFALVEQIRTCGDLLEIFLS